MKKIIWFTTALLMVLVLVLSACSPAPAPMPTDAPEKPAGQAPAELDKPQPTDLKIAIITTTPKEEPWNTVAFFLTSGGGLTVSINLPFLAIPGISIIGEF